jgi:pilus assembly protein CpaB
MRRLFLVIAAVLVASVGTSMVYLYVRGADARALGQQRVQTVLVASRTLTVGTAADSLPVESRDLPRTAVIEGAVDSLEQVSGKVLMFPVVAGQQLSVEMFSARSKIPEGQVAVSVRIAEENRVPALLTSGDTVNIYVRSGGNLDRLMTGVQVHQIGGQDVSGASIDSSNVTFILDPSAAEDLLTADAAQGDLVLTVGNPTG